MRKITMGLPELLPGDIILSKNNTILSTVIRWFEGLQTRKARVSHAAMALGHGLVIESLWRVRINDLAKYEKQRIVVYRLKDHSDEERQNVARRAMKLAGDSYGLLKLPLFALDGLSSWTLRLFGWKKPVYFWTSKFGITNFRVCSQFLMYCWYKFGNHSWPINWRSGSPDFLDDYCDQNAEKILETL